MRVTDYDHLPNMKLIATVINFGTLGPAEPSRIEIANMRQAKEGFWAGIDNNGNVVAEWDGNVWIPPHRIYCVETETVYRRDHCDL